jgi:hypothetical protein
LRERRAIRSEATESPSSLSFTGDEREGEEKEIDKK